MNKGMVDRGFAVLKQTALKWLLMVWLRIEARCCCSNECFVPHMLNEICHIDWLPVANPRVVGPEACAVFGDLFEKKNRVMSTKLVRK